MITEDALHQLLADDPRVQDALSLIVRYAESGGDAETVVEQTHQCAAYVLETYPAVDVPEPVLAAWFGARVHLMRFGELPRLRFDVEPPKGRPN